MTKRSLGPKCSAEPHLVLNLKPYRMSGSFYTSALPWALIQEFHIWKTSSSSANLQRSLEMVLIYVVRWFYKELIAKRQLIELEFYQLKKSPFEGEIMVRTFKHAHIGVVLGWWPPGKLLLESVTGHITKFACRNGK